MNESSISLSPSHNQQRPIAVVKHQGHDETDLSLNHGKPLNATKDGDSRVYRMVALDLDGTLLQSNHELADEQVEYLRRLDAVGVTICIATGRAPPSVYEHVKKLALPKPLPVVCSNGARGLLLSFNNNDNEAEITAVSSAEPTLNRNQEEVFYTPVTGDVVRKTIQLAKKMGYCTQYYLDDGIYANPITSSHHRLLQVYKDITRSDIVVVEDDFELLINGSNDDTPGHRHGLPSKLLVRFEQEEFEKAHEAFLKMFCPDGPDSPSRLATIIPGFIPAADWFLEILHPDVNKGQGLINMCKALKVPIEQTVAMGDGTNDIEFLKLAGLGIAMKNAHPSLKSVADYTMEWTNDQHGVTKTIKSLRAEGRLISETDVIMQ